MDPMGLSAPRADYIEIISLQPIKIARDEPIGTYSTLHVHKRYITNE